MDKHIEVLSDIVGKDNLLTAPDDLARYGTDWTRFYTPDPAAVVLVRDIEQLCRLVKFANEQKLALVPSGGRTGLSAGAVAANREIVVSFEKMDNVLDFDPVEGVVVVEAGVITQTLQEFAEGNNLFYPVDFSSSGSSQIGGNIATNAGGIKVLKYGLTRDQRLGLKVVTGAGEVLELNRGLVKNATGYDFRHLFIGSEGTLGFIVEATIQLIKPPNNLTVALLAVPSMVSVMSVLTEFRARLGLTAYEFFSQEALNHVMQAHDVPPPFKNQEAYYALIEFELSASSDMDAAMQAFESCVAMGYATDGVISQSEAQRESMWKYREHISESISKFTPYKNDISVRVSKVPAFLEEVQQTVATRYPYLEIVWFGHIGDGNLHLNILKPSDWAIDDFKRECENVSEEVLGLVAKYEGSISAEHGIGMLKRDQLGITRSAEEIALMRAIKKIFDPNGIMNPGKLLA